MTSATQGAKGRQRPRFFTDLNKRWRLPLFLFFCASHSLSGDFMLKTLAAQRLFGSKSNSVAASAYRAPLVEFISYSAFQASLQTEIVQTSHGVS